MNRSWKNKPHSGRGLPFRGGRGRGWNNKFYGRQPPLLDNPMATNNKYRFINPNQHRRYYEEQMPHQYEYPPNHGNPSWGHHNRNNFEYKHQNFHHFIPPHPPPPLIPSNSPRLARPSSPLPGSEEYIQREINEKSEYLKRHLELAVTSEENFLEDTDISNFSDNLYKVVPSNKIHVSEIDGESATMQKNEIVRKQHKPMRQQKSQNVLNVNEIHSKILNHISNMSFGQKVNLVNQVTPTSYDVALHQINRQKRLELSKALRDMCNDQLKEVQNSTEIINSIIPDFDIKIEELPIELVHQLSTTLNENLSEVVQDCSVDPELFFQQAAEMLNTSLEIENSNSVEVNCNRDNYDNFMEEIPNDEAATEAQFQNVDNSNVPLEFEENIFESQSFLPPTLIDFPVQNDDSNNLNSKSMVTELLDNDLLPVVQNDDLLPPVQNDDFPPGELYGNERNDSNNLNSNLALSEPLEDDLLPTVHNADFTVDDLYSNERNDGNNLNSKSVLNEPLDDDLLPSVQNDDLTADEFYGNETNGENLPSATEEEQNPPLLSNRFEFDHETESLLNFEETSQYRNPWFNPSPPLGKDETENFLSTVTESPSLARQESPQTLTDPSWDLPTIEEANVNFGEACQDEEENHILESNLNFINKPCPDEEESPIIESNLDFINKSCPDEVESQIDEANLKFINKPCPDEEVSQIVKSNLNFINEPCPDEKQSQIVESNLNDTCRNEEQNQFVIQAIKPVVSFLNDELNQVNVLRDDILVESNMAGINKNRYEEEADNNYRSSESSSTENTDRLSSESSKNCSPEKDYKREQERFRKIQKRNYHEERRSHKYRTKYVDEKREKRGEDRLRGRDFEEGRRYVKDRWNRDTRHPKRYYRDELHPHRLEYEDENVYVHNKYKNSHLRSKPNYYHSYEEYSRKHKESKDYKKPEKLKSDVLKDRIDKKLISRSTSEESNSKSLQKSLKDRIEVMLKHSTKSACEDAKAEESLVLQNAGSEMEQQEAKIESQATKKKNVEKKRSSYREVAPVDLKICSKIKKKIVQHPELEEFILKKEIETDLSQDGLKDDDNDKNSKSEDISLEKETRQLQEDDDNLVEENLSPPYTPPLLNHVFAQKEQVSEEVPSINVVPNLSPKKTCIQDHVKQTPPKIWRSPGEKKFMMELYPPKLEQNLLVAKTSIETTQLCSKSDQATNNGHLVVLTNRTNPLSFSETNTTDIVAELENCINSMTKRTAIDILNSSEVSSTSDTLKLHEKSELKRITKPLHQHLEIGKKGLDKIIETDKSENSHQIMKIKQTTSTQTSVKQKSASVQVMPNFEVQSMSTGIQTNPVVAFENNNEILETSTASGINRKVLKATHKKKVVQRMREIDKEIERLTKLRQSLYNYITSDNDSDNDQTTSSQIKPSESGKRKRKGSVNSKSNKKSRRNSPNNKIRHGTTVDSVEEVSEKRSRSHLSRKSNTSENREMEVSVENCKSGAASKDIAVSEKRSECSLSNKCKASENLEIAAAVESHQRTEKAERRSESSLSHRSRASENQERCPSVESHGKGESKDGVTERRSESSLSHKSKASDCLEGCVSVDNSGTGLTKGVAISEKAERRSNSSSSHKSKQSENHKRGTSKESHGRGESKDNVDKKVESSFSHKSCNETNTSRETRKRDASKDKVEKLSESSASCKNDVLENREKSSSIVTHKRTSAVISDKIVKKSRSSHKSSALENREKDTSTESNSKAPYVVIKKIVQTPESNLSHNNERVESLEKQKEVHKAKNKSKLDHKYIAPETHSSNVAAEIQNATSEKIENVSYPDSDVVKPKDEKSKIKKIESSPIKKSRKRSYVCKSRSRRKRGKNLEKVKNVKIDGATAKLESPTATIHENVTDISSVEAAVTIDNSSVSCAENVTNIESTFSIVSVSDSTNVANTLTVSLSPTVASLSDVPSVSCATTSKIISSVSPSPVITKSDTGSVSPVTVNQLKMKRVRERKSNNQYSKTIQEVAKETTDATLKSTEILPIASSISCPSTVGSTADVLSTFVVNPVISKSDAELVLPKLPEVVSRVTASRSKMKGPRGRKQINQYAKTIEEVAKEKTEISVLDNPELNSEVLPIGSSISCTATVSSAADALCTPTVNSISNVTPAANAETAVISESDAKLLSPKLPEVISRFTTNRSKTKGSRARKQNNQYSKTIEEVAKETTEISVPDNPEVNNEVLPIGSSILSTTIVSSAADVSFTPTVTSISNALPAANVKTAVISESDAKLLSPILSESVPPIIPNRSKIKGSRGRKSNQQYSKTIEEVVKENTETKVLDNPEAKSEILLPITSTVSSTADVSCTSAVKSISNVSPTANIKTAVISSESDAELVSPILFEIVPEVVLNRSKMKGPRGRKSNKQYSKTIEEVVKESIDVPVLDNPEPTSKILPITSSVSSVSCAATTVKSVSNAVIAESEAELVSSKLLEVVPRVNTNRSKLKGPRGRKSNNHYSETIEQVIKERLDVPLLDDPEPTNEILPIISNVACDVAVESNAELVSPTLETVLQITPNCSKLKGPRGRKTSTQNSKANKEVAKETIDLPVPDNPEPISKILQIGGDDGFTENEMKKRPGKRRRDVDPTVEPEVQKKFKASNRRNSNKMNSVEIVGKINMFPVVSLPRCEELEFKLKDLSNGDYISNDCEENVSSPAEMLPVKEEVEEESTKTQQENITEETTNATEMIASCLTVDENYEINFSGFTGAILVIKVIASTAIAASDKGKLFWFNLLTGELLSTHHLSNLPITSIIVVKRNNESVMYVGSLDTSITIMNFEKNAIVKKTNVDEPIQCMELAWNSIFIGSDRGSLITYDLKTEQVVEDIKISESNVLMIKATQEGPRKVLVIATRNALVSVRDAKTGLLLRTMETPFLPTVYTLLFDKNLIYCGTSQHDILVYTFEDGQLIFKHEATKSKGVVCMQIVGNLLFAGCYNGNIYVYNTKTNVYLGTMCGPGGLMLSMEIVRDKIIVGTKSSNFKAWRIPQKYLDQN